MWANGEEGARQWLEKDTRKGWLPTVCWEGGEQNSDPGLWPQEAWPLTGRQGQGVAWVTYSIGDVPAEHHPGLVLSLRGPVQHEAKAPIDHLTPARGKEVSRPLPGPTPPGAGRTPCISPNILEALAQTAEAAGWTLPPAAHSLLSLGCLGDVRVTLLRVVGYSSCLWSLPHPLQRVTSSTVLSTSYRCPSWWGLLHCSIPSNSS